MEESHLIEYVLMYALGCISGGFLLIIILIEYLNSKFK